MNLIKNFDGLADTTEYLYIGKNVYSDMEDDFRKFCGNTPIYIIQDENTKKAAGDYFYTYCNKIGVKVLENLTFPSIPELDASYENVTKIVEKLKDNNAIPVVVGSGTLNDLVKRAAFELKRKYMVFATATSVDGYASDGAALIYNGLKQTLQCPAPAFIAADSSVLIDAPINASSAGYSDLLAKNPSGADWIIADILNIDKIDMKVWPVIQNNLLQWTENPKRLPNKEESIFNSLMEGLNVAGFTMQHLKRSRPVSGAEHLMSHVWEMEDLTFNGKHVSHGFKVAMGSLASIALMEELFKIDIEKFDINNAVENWPSWEVRVNEIKLRFDGVKDIDNLLEINESKYIDSQQLKVRLNQVVREWSNIKHSVLKHILPYSEIRNRFLDAGCPTKPGDIGLTREHIIESYEKAQMLRNRYTILDLVYEMGLFPRLLKNIDKNINYFN